MDDQTKFVPAKIKNDAIVAHKVDRRAELTLDIAGALPTCLGGDREPSTNWAFSLPMPLPELLECPASDDLHRQRIACHQFGDKCVRIRLQAGRPLGDVLVSETKVREPVPNRGPIFETPLEEVPRQLAEAA